MNCRAMCTCVEPRAPGLLRTILACIAIAVLGSSAASASSYAELDDAAARLQYAFLTADARALEQVLKLIEDLELPSADEALRSYHVAYGYWKLAQLQSTAPETRAASLKAAKQCATHARTATQKNARLAEGYALEAICEELPQATMRLASLQRGGCEKHRGLKIALNLAPQNPRVLLIDRMCSAKLTDAATLSPARWQQVVDAFANEPPRASHQGPDWGHAEALTLLGEIQIQHGNAVAARDAIERALVLAPDYSAAQDALQAAARTR